MTSASLTNARATEHQPNAAATALAVLTSGGLDSAILLAESVKVHETVWPLYVRTGLFWEPAEQEHLRHFLEKIACESLKPLQRLELPVGDIYGNHWSLTGKNVPDARSRDEAVFLPGRNLLLLAKSMLWCHLRGVPALALAVLKANPFPDATPSFFAACQHVMNESVGGQVVVLRPYDTLSKTEVMHKGQGLPLQFTFSCIRPIGERHCGACNKCAERQKAFVAARMVDPTDYAAGEPCTA
jgi:7-cyano-7-deazaguanine synthase